MIDFPQWPIAVWVNIATSITVAICFLTFLIFGWFRRKRLKVVQDVERLSVTFVIIGIIAFFIGRGVQIAVAGSTVADPWFLFIGGFLAIACLISTGIVASNHDDYGVLGKSDPEWKKGDPDRRVGDRRIADRRSDRKQS